MPLSLKCVPYNSFKKEWKRQLLINPLTPEPPVQDSTALKNCNFLNRVNITLTISCHHSLESPSNFRYPIKAKISAIFAEYQCLNLDKNKNDRF